jgi:hypothetical protein
MIKQLWRNAVIFKLGAAAILLAGAWQASASSLQPYIDPPGAVSGLPGDTVGWGFKIYNPTQYWVSFTGSSWTQSTPLDVMYQDFIGLLGGPGSDLAIAPAQNFGTLSASPTIWQLAFDPSGNGIGQFVIDPGAPMPSTDFGPVEIDYALYDGSPMLGGSQVGTGQLTLDGLAPGPSNIPQLVVNIQTPEPSSTFPLAVAAAAWIGLSLRRRFAK